MYVTSNNFSAYTYLTQREKVVQPTQTLEKSSQNDVVNSTEKFTSSIPESGNSYAVGNDRTAEQSNSSQTISKDKEAETLFNTSQIAQSATSPNTANSTFVLDTSHGQNPIDLDEYFEPREPLFEFNLKDIPILMPTKSNMQAIRQHTEERLEKFLKANNIPEGPAEISFDNEGNLQLPQDYAYKEEFRNALSSATGLSKELSTLAAMGSHYNAFQQIAETGRAPYYNEKITLNFDESGHLIVNANGKALDFDQKTAANNNVREEQTDEDAEESDDVAARDWFLDYMQKTPEERYFEDLLRELGMTPEEYAALSPEEKLEVDKKIEERMKQDAEQNATRVG